MRYEKCFTGLVLKRKFQKQSKNMWMLSTKTKISKVNDDMIFKFKFLATAKYNGSLSANRMLSFLILGIKSAI